MAKVKKTDLIITRNGTLDDFSFIYATWLKGLKHGSEYFDAVDSQAFYSGMSEIIRQKLDNPDNIIKIAALKEAPEVILGYAVYSGDILHWVHVKKAWRGIGVARLIVPETIKVITQANKLGLGYLKSHPGLKFNPFLL